MDPSSLVHHFLPCLQAGYRRSFFCFKANHLITSHHHHLKGQIVAERNLLKQMLLHIYTRKVSDLDIATECRKHHAYLMSQIQILLIISNEAVPNIYKPEFVCLTSNSHHSWSFEWSQERFILFQRDCFSMQGLPVLLLGAFKELEQWISQKHQVNL